MTGAVADAAAKRAASDAALVDRAVERWAAGLAVRQKRREAVARKAVQYLADDPPDAQKAAAPSEDFMSYFEDVVDKASSEALQDFMARVLAGEIRKPGSISRRALQIVSVMDQTIAQAIWEINPWVVNGDWLPFFGKLNHPHMRAKIELLDNALILRMTEVSGFDFRERKERLLRTRGGAILLTGDGMSDIFGAAHVTPVGLEILSVLPEALESKGDKQAFDLKALKGVEKVETCDAEPVEGGWKLTNCQQV